MCNCLVYERKNLIKNVISETENTRLIKHFYAELLAAEWTFQDEKRIHFFVKESKTFHVALWWSGLFKRKTKELQIKRKGDKSSFSGDSSLGRKAAIAIRG